MISNFLVELVDFVWGLPLLFLLLGGGSYLLFVSKLVPLKGFFLAIRLVAGKFHHDGDGSASGQISHFKALCNALSSTVGMGNIAGVAVAISQGGAGAIFWMWVAALIGMNTKFFECSLAVMYRGKDYRGETQGGPMYVIRQALPKSMGFLSVTFAIFGMIGTLPLFQVNQLSSFVNQEYPLGTFALFGAEIFTTQILVGIVSALGVGYILFGGVRRIANWTSSLVPPMCVFYVICGLVILFIQAEKIPSMFALIFHEAFNGRAAFGGAMGIGIVQVLKIGVKRAAFSNEAGIGSAPMAHGNAKTSEPISEGLVAMLGPFLDTIIVCTITALVILCSLPPEALLESNGVLLTANAFEASLPGFGMNFLGVAIVLFSVTTMIGTANYFEKCWSFLFEGKQFFGSTTLILVFCLALVIGSIATQDDVINLIDSGFALMAVPNMIATIWLAPKVKAALREYFRKYA